MHFYHFVDDGSVGSVLFDVALMPVYFDLFRLLTLVFVRLPLRLVKIFNLYGVQLYEMGFRPFVGSVHLTLIGSVYCGSVHFMDLLKFEVLPLLYPSTLWT